MIDLLREVISEEALDRILAETARDHLRWIKHWEKKLGKGVLDPIVPKQENGLEPESLSR